MDSPSERWQQCPAWDVWRRRLTREPSCSLAALPDAARAFALTSLLRGLSRPVLILADSVRHQEELANELTVWGHGFDYFPDAPRATGEQLPDPDIVAERLAVASRLDKTYTGTILATREGAAASLPEPKRLRAARLVLKTGQEMSRDALIGQLEKAGYTREVEAQGQGQFAVRGSVLDVFPWDAQRPLRTEWFDNELETLREFEPHTQRSTATLSEAVLSLFDSGKGAAESSATLQDYLPAKVLKIFLGQPEEEDAPLIDLEFFAHDFLNAPRGDVVLQEHRRELFLDHLLDWLAEKWEVVIYCNNEGEEHRLREILREAGLDPDGITFLQGPLLRGFVWPQAKLVVLSDAEIFGRYQTLRGLRKQERLLAVRQRQNALDFSEWAEGDYVVHLHYGIALYAGVQSLPGPEGQQPEVLVLQFAEDGRLYVPIEQAYLISKYVGVGKRHPTLDTLGGSRWERAKVATKKAVFDYAAQLLKVQAERQTLKGHAYPVDTPWQKEFEDSFLYEETEDQLKCIDDAKNDMESSKPMDRLICGDVGFGKTEVAIRAIFKAVMGGKQVAFLAPTTILAQQHYNSLCQRFADYPIRVELLCRFRTAKQQKESIAKLKARQADIVVGTHRLISKDVQFADLGLAVVDEEQRFGVVQKEKLKQLFRLVDVLTLSATPIPRTLYLSLTGARDMSTIETPPVNRQPVETIVAPYDERTIREAIERELARGGQVYFLHNRVQSIQQMADKIQLLVPHARLGVGHGQMDEDELEEVMRKFIAGETDVLLSTTIIESGLDIPNANTILIDRADRFGLADLYQLRGRVGRAGQKAYAYLFLPRHLMSVGDARKRVNAIRQYTQLGAGFKIAMRDLEIRGAGNLLGTAQSGHITAVGFDLYCQMLKMAVEQMKGNRPRRLVDTKLELDFLNFQEGAGAEHQSDACLPRKYLAEARWRMDGYRRIAEAATPEDVDALRAEWKDRFGPWPPAVDLLLLATEIRVLAAQRRITRVECRDEKLVLERNQDFIMVGGKFPRLTSSTAKNRLAEIKKWIVSLASG